MTESFVTVPTLKLCQMKKDFLIVGFLTVFNFSGKLHDQQLTKTKWSSVRLVRCRTKFHKTVNLNLTEITKKHELTPDSPVPTHGTCIICKLFMIYFLIRT